MKQFLQLVLILPVITFVGCGGKKNAAPVSNISSQYKLKPFYDVNNPSTLDLEELKDLPTVVDLRDQMTSTKDQDTRGSCTFFSVLGVVEAAVKKKMKVDVNFSEEYLIYQVKKSGAYAKTDGGSSYSNIKAINNLKKGFLFERDWPYQPSWFGAKKPCLDFDDNDRNALAECYSHNSPNESTLSKIIPMDNFSIEMMYLETTNDLIRVLADKKQPLIFGIAVNSKGWPDNGETQYTEEMRQDCINHKEDCGGHEAILTGYDLNKKVFFFKNSWGAKWGNGGYGTIPFEVVDRHVEKDFGRATLNKDIELPADLNAQNYALKKFNIESIRKSDGSVAVDSDTEVFNSGLYPLWVNLAVVQKKSSFANNLADDNNVIVLTPSDSDKKDFGVRYLSQDLLVFPDESSNVIKWKINEDNDLALSAKMLSIPTITALRSSVDDKLLYRSTLFLFTDEGPKVLKRYYHTENFNNL